MRLHTYLRKSLLGKAALAAAALGGLLFFVGAPSAQAADHRDSCERRIARNEYRLHEAVEDHGYYSHQANHWRHELHEAYERCDRYRYRDNRYRGYDRDDDRYQRRYDRDWDRDRY